MNDGGGSGVSAGSGLNAVRTNGKKSKYHVADLSIMMDDPEMRPRILDLLTQSWLDSGVPQAFLQGVQQMPLITPGTSEFNEVKQEVRESLQQQVISCFHDGLEDKVAMPLEMQAMVQSALKDSLLLTMKDKADDMEPGKRLMAEAFIEDIGAVMSQPKLKKILSRDAPKRRLEIKTLKGDGFQVEVVAHGTAADLKHEVEATSPDFAASGVKAIVFKGKVLDDHARLDDLEINAEDPFVCLPGKAKRSPEKVPPKAAGARRTVEQENQHVAKESTHVAEDATNASIPSLSKQLSFDKAVCEEPVENLEQRMQRMSAALVEIAGSTNSPDVQSNALQTLLFIAENPEKQPAEKRFRKIKESNAIFRQYIAQARGGIAAMLAMGWVLDSGGDEDIWILPDRAMPEIHVHCSTLAKGLTHQTSISSNRPGDFGRVENVFRQAHGTTTGHVQQEVKAESDRDTHVSVEQIAMGTYVRIRDLRAKPQLNGQIGPVLDYDGSTQRYEVRLGDINVKVKVANLDSLTKEKPPKEDISLDRIEEWEQHAFLDKAKADSWVDVQEFVRFRPNIANAMPCGRWSALHHAAGKGNKEMVNFLLEHKAQLDAKDKAGDTPFDVAGNTDVYRLLLAAASRAQHEEEEIHLPREIEGKTILVDAGGGKWTVTNEFWKSKAKGISYRKSKNMSDKVSATDVMPAAWGSTISAISVDEHWVTVKKASQTKYPPLVVSSSMDILCGKYSFAGETNGRPSYKRVHRPDGNNAWIYFWDDHDNPEEQGWCIGAYVASPSATNAIGGKVVWNHSSHTSLEPPTSGWDPPVEIKPVQLVKCPKRHVLVRFNLSSRHLNFVCDGCQAGPFGAGDQMWGCGECDYDLCTKCYEKESSKEQTEKKEADKAEGDDDNDDYYELLGVSKTATEADIKKAYRVAALKWHPDKNPDDKEKSEKMFKKLSNAYSVLADSEKRRHYDMFGPEGARGKGGINPEDIFAEFFRDMSQAGDSGLFEGFEFLFEGKGKGKGKVMAGLIGMAMQAHIMEEIMSAKGKGKGKDGKDGKIGVECALQ